MLTTASHSSFGISRAPHWSLSSRSTFEFTSSRVARLLVEAAPSGDLCTTVRDDDRDDSLDDQASVLFCWATSRALPGASALIFAAMLVRIGLITDSGS